MPAAIKPRPPHFNINPIMIPLTRNKKIQERAYSME